MARGALVPDDIVVEIVGQRIEQPDARKGFILDGFPRNLAQAHALDHLLESLRQPLDAVVQLEVNSAELVRRISGRRTCADCGRVFNLLTSPPHGAQALCPKTGQPHRLVQRPDDNEATVAERLRVYDEKTHPLIDFYRARGLLRVIDAEGQVDTVTRRLAQALGVPALARAPKRTAPAPRRASEKKRPAGASARAERKAKAKPAARKARPGARARRSRR
jgi:adenylate kinase